MLRSIVICSVLALASALSDVDQACINANNAANSNDALLGSWFKIYQFTLFGGLVPSAQCNEIKFTKPTAAELQEYRNLYNTPGLPYSLDDNPLIMEESRFEGLIMGDKETKFYILKPNSGTILNEGYYVYVYRRIDDKFMLFWECSLRGNIRWLLTRDRNATVEEMQQVINSRPELNNMGANRFCYNW